MDGSVEVGLGEGWIGGGGRKLMGGGGGLGEEEGWINGVEVDQWRKMDGSVDDDLPKLPSLVAGLACTTVGLWVGDDNLSFTDGAVGRG